MPTAPEFLNDGRYRIDKVLGVGGMSVVLLAFDTRMQVPRAIKLLHKRFARNPQVRERFENEATAQAGLRHPNILMVHDVVDDPAGVYLVMELAEGGSLADQVKETGPLSPADVARIGATVARALGAAHKEGVVHRDIKPENILRDRHGTLKIADFGIARVVARNANLTQTGMVMGTWAYMPPEQRESARQVDGRADIYALGASLFYLLTARQPSALHNPETHGREYEGVPEGLARAIQKATRLYPEDRYETAEEMAQELEALLPSLADKPLYEHNPGQAQGATLAPALKDLSTYLEQHPDAAETLAPFLPGMEEGPSGEETPAPAANAPTAPPTAAPGPATPAPIVNLAEAAIPSQSPTVVSSPTPTVLGPAPAPAPSPESRATRLLAMATVLLAAVVAMAVLLPRRDGGANEGPAAGRSPELATLDRASAPVAEAPAAPPAEPPPSDPPPTTTTSTVREPRGTTKPPPEPDPTGGAGSAPQPRIITVAAEPTRGGAEADPGGGSGSADPTGTVVVRTVPSGATVSLKGERLSPSGRGYVLPTGSHVLDVQSPSGETTRIPVVIRRDKTIEVCYSFDTNSACADP